MGGIFNIEKKLCDIKPQKKAENNFQSFPFSAKPPENIKSVTKFRLAQDKLLERDAPFSFENAITKDPQKQEEAQSDDIYYKVKKTKIRYKVSWKKILISAFLIFTALLLFLLFSFKDAFVSKDAIIQNSFSAYEHVNLAKDHLKELDFKNAGFEFTEAYKEFSKAQSYIGSTGSKVLGAFSFLPYISKAYSSNNLLNVGIELSYAGKLLSEAAEPIFKISSDAIFKNSEDVSKDSSFGKSLDAAIKNIADAKLAVAQADKSLNGVNPLDLPEKYQASVIDLKNKFPDIKNAINDLSDYSGFFMWLLGYDNPKNFLIISQNTAEARPTGGFIGSYGLMQSEYGYIKDIFMDNIYNIDGQLLYKEIPPRPIQKISTAWSMHDANWFLDFPTSAKKVAFFYEKAGGPTPDGVISINEKVMERLLEVTGPINMADYGVIIDANNFVEIVQYKVESDYDKNLNQPKKILDDLLVKIFEKFSTLKKEDLTKLFNVFLESLESKDILIWANHPSYQKFVLDKGWGGNVLEAPGADYFSFVSTNINGFKSDKMIDQTIKKTTELEEDGTLIDTVTVTRKHNGGNEKYDWYNRVNSSYERLYVPLGSDLLEISGNTKEKYESPINYEKSGFKEDGDVKNSINSVQRDDKNGVDIFTESGKTVFGSWVYVSPGEEVSVTYKYRLPFKLDPAKKGNDMDFVFQVQPGSDSNLDFQVNIPEDWGWIYTNPEKFWGHYQGSFSKDLFFSLGVGH